MTKVNAKHHEEADICTLPQRLMPCSSKQKPPGITVKVLTRKLVSTQRMYAREQMVMKRGRQLWLKQLLIVLFFLKQIANHFTSIEGQSTRKIEIRECYQNYIIRFRAQWKVVVAFHSVHGSGNHKHKKFTCIKCNNSTFILRFYPPPSFQCWRLCTSQYNHLGLD